MRNKVAIRERFLRDTPTVRLGGIAANLARIQSFSNHPDHRDAVENLIEESKFFIEWAAPEAELEVQVKLVELQIQLAIWQHGWKRIWENPSERKAAAEQAGKWSGEVLEMSGLLK